MEASRKSGYAYNWYKFTVPVFVLLSFYMIFWGVETLSAIQIILMCSFMALLIHQFEEYILPGGGAILINRANFGEKEHFRNYPGNMKSSMIVNNLAYLIYILAFLFPQLIWLGIGTMFFNLFQFIGHGIQMNRALKTWYTPGLISVLLLFIPISVYYFIFISKNNLVSGWDWIFGVFTFIGALLITTILPVQLMKNKNSPYTAPEQMVEEFYKVKNFASFRKTNK